MRILGLSCFYHDAAAALICDGEVVAAAAEERFTREKHSSDFPSRAVEYCLREAGITIDDVDHIVFYEKPFVKMRRILEAHLSTWPWSWRSWCRALPVWLGKKIHIGRIIQKELGTDRDILFCLHHLSHAASAFFASPFDDAAVLTTDGVGEWGTTTAGVGEGSRIEIERQISYPHSIGLFYSALTAYLGFRVNDAEWKVMGLAPYGEPRYLDRFHEMIDVKPDGSFRFDLRYFSFHRGGRSMYSRRWKQLLGRPARRREAEMDDFYRDVAHSGQELVEEILVRLADDLHRRSGKRRLVVAGGVGLNSVANWRMLKETGFEDIYIQPAAGDDGGAVGAALYVAHAVLGAPRRERAMSAYLGPGFGQDEIESYLRSVEAPCAIARDDDELVDTTARLIAEGKVVGWFAGRMELGPRALGNRSIIADPRRAESKERVNSTVKYREEFRPFAPSVVHERAHEFFGLEPGQDAPYMLLVPPVLEHQRAVIPAVTHVDGTGRVQTVRREENPLWHALIQRFGEITGVPVILNTSFNVRGEPIVCTPEDAYRTFCRTGLDALVIGRCVVTEKPRDVDFEAGRKRSEDLERTVL